MQPLSSISRTRITPITQELQPVWDRRRAAPFKRFCAWCRADVLHSRCQCKTTRRHGTRGPGHRAGRLCGLRPPWEPPKDRVGDWDLKVYAAVRASLIVVMLDELPQYTVEMSLTANEQPVQALGPGCPHEPFGERVGPRRPYGSEDDPGARRPRVITRSCGCSTCSRQ